MTGTKAQLAALGAMALLAALPAQAEPPRLDLLNLSASASQEVERDTLGVMFSTTKEGADAASVQSALKAALDAALVEARKIAKPGQVELQSGNFSLYPRYAPKGGISGWQGSAELLVQGRDAATIAQLTGRISSMSIGRVGYSLSREAREKAEAELTEQAVARFRAQAASQVRLFGYSGYRIGEVSINSLSGQPTPMMAAAPRFKSSAIMADEALPVEAGKATVTVTVNGNVLMTK